MTGEPVTRTAWPVRLTIALCLLVVLAALLAAWAQRPDARAGDQRAAAPLTTRQDPGCGGSTCRVLASMLVNGHAVELLAGPNGRSGKLRITGPGIKQVIDVSITDRGVRLDQDSLRCISATTPACLVTGPTEGTEGGVIGEVLLARGQSWASLGRPYLSDAGIMALDNVVAGDTPEVVVVRHTCAPRKPAAACGKTPLVAQVYDLGGKILGCTQRYPWPARIPGWPTINLNADQLQPCR